MTTWFRWGCGVLGGWGHGTPRGHDATMAVAPPVAVASVLARRSWAVELTDTRWSQGHAVIPGGKHMEL